MRRHRPARPGGHGPPVPCHLRVPAKDRVSGRTGRRGLTGQAWTGRGHTDLGPGGFTQTPPRGQSSLMPPEFFQNLPAAVGRVLGWTRDSCCSGRSWGSLGRCCPLCPAASTGRLLPNELRATRSWRLKEFRGAIIVTWGALLSKQANPQWHTLQSPWARESGRWMGLPAGLGTASRAQQ